MQSRNEWLARPKTLFWMFCRKWKKKNWTYQVRINRKRKLSWHRKQSRYVSLRPSIGAVVGSFAKENSSPQYCWTVGAARSLFSFYFWFLRFFINSKFIASWMVRKDAEKMRAKKRRRSEDTGSVVWPLIRGLVIFLLVINASLEDAIRRARFI